MLAKSTLISDNNTNEKSANTFGSLQVVTVSCHSVLNTQLISPSKKPEWFDDLNSKLDAAKVLATNWIDDIAPEITSKIPSQVLDYGSTYQAITDEILELIHKNPTAKGVDNPVVKQVIELIEALKQSLKSIVDEIISMEKTLKEWGDKMQAAHDNLKKGAASIQKAQVDLNAHISKLNSHIEQLNKDIKTYNKFVTGGAITVGLGIFTAIVGLAIVVASAGTAAAVGGVVMGVGVAGIIGGSVTWAVAQNKINKAKAQIAENLAEIEADKRQIASLQAIATSTDGAVYAMTIATQALSDVKTMWNLFDMEVSNTIEKLNKAEADVSILVRKAHIKSAQHEWDLAMQFAQGLVGMDVKMTQRELEAA